MDDGQPMLMEHGGQLAAASRRYAIAQDEWLDLSTGIAPWSWPVPPVPEAVWARLPDAQDDLLDAAAQYYRCPADRLTAVPGSQFAIRQLPQTVPRGAVAVPAVGYTEHAHSWGLAGHAVYRYDDMQQLQALAPQVDHVVVINPNNPTAQRLDRDRLHALRRAMGDGLLIVDEAFADTGGSSLLPEDALPGVVVLRSVGKFFGLAGLRLGFVAGSGPTIDEIRRQLQPWGVSHPARWVGARALRDTDWQRAQRQRIHARGERLVALLEATFPGRDIRSAGLFATVLFDDASTAPACFEALARRGVLTRLGDNRRWLRFGLPAGHGERLASALEHMQTAVA